MKLSDLDTIIDRRGSGCLKYDFAVHRGKPKDVLPFWVTSDAAEVRLVAHKQPCHNLRYGMRCVIFR